MMTGPQIEERTGDKMSPVQMKTEIVFAVISSAQRAILRTQLNLDMAVGLISLYQLHKQASTDSTASCEDC